MAKINIQLLSQELARREAKKVSVSIGNIREVLARLSDIAYEVGCVEIAEILYNNGKNRAKKGKNSAAKKRI